MKKDNLKTESNNANVLLGDSKIRLTKSEKKIYDSVMASFPATAHESAIDIAIQGGVNWQFYPR
jgi:DNA-binding MurR/RpiR family transcriptional regulator